jgi:hypothetical protein
MDLSISPLLIGEGGDRMGPPCRRPHPVGLETSTCTTVVAFHGIQISALELRKRGDFILQSGPTANGRHVWAEDTATGKRRNLSYEDEEAFWAFATIEVLRLTCAARNT